MTSRASQRKRRSRTTSPLNKNEDRLSERASIGSQKSCRGFKDRLDQKGLFSRGPLSICESSSMSARGSFLTLSNGVEKLIRNSRKTSTTRLEEVTAVPPRRQTSLLLQICSLTLLCCSHHPMTHNFFLCQHFQTLGLLPP